MVQKRRDFFDEQHRDGIPCYLKTYELTGDLFLWKTMFKTVKTQKNSNYFVKTDPQKSRREKKKTRLF